MNSLKDKIIIITGGSQGLGRAIAETLSEERAIIFICDIKTEQAQQTAKELSKKGAAAEGYALDVGDENSVEQLVNEVINKYGRIDALINNAGIDVTKPLTELSIDEFDRVIRVNLRGPFLMSKAVFPIMAKQETGGSIVNISSTAAKRTWENASAYHASKWGLLGFSHGIHTEGRNSKIKVTAVIAGGMRTPFILERFPETDPRVLQDPKNVAQAVKFTLLQPEETVIPEIMVLPVRETSWP